MCFKPAASDQQTKFVNLSVTEAYYFSYARRLDGTHHRRVDGTECAIQVLRIEGTVHPRTHLLD
jgi:hypothetical protein